MSSTADAGLTVAAADFGGEGSYSVRITAQYINGDPYFINESYYSYSEQPGSLVMFGME